MWPMWFASLDSAPDMLFVPDLMVQIDSALDTVIDSHVRTEITLKRVPEHIADAIGLVLHGLITRA